MSSQQQAIQQLKKKHLKPSEVIIIYGSDWCPYCRMAVSICKKLDKRYKKLYAYVFIEVSEIKKGSVDEQIFENYGDGSIPLIFTKNLKTGKFKKIGGLSQYEKYAIGQSKKMERQMSNIDQQIIEIKVAYEPSSSAKKKKKSQATYIDQSLIESDGKKRKK